MEEVFGHRRGSVIIVSFLFCVTNATEVLETLRDGLCIMIQIWGPVSLKPKLCELKSMNWEHKVDKCLIK